MYAVSLVEDMLGGFDVTDVFCEFTGCCWLEWRWEELESLGWDWEVGRSEGDLLVSGLPISASRSSPRVPSPELDCPCPVRVSFTLPNMSRIGWE